MRTNRLLVCLLMVVALGSVWFFGCNNAGKSAATAPTVNLKVIPPPPTPEHAAKEYRDPPRPADNPDGDVTVVLYKWQKGTPSMSGPGHLEGVQLKVSEKMAHDILDDEARWTHSGIGIVRDGHLWFAEAGIKAGTSWTLTPWPEKVSVNVGESYAHAVERRFRELRSGSKWDS